MINIKTIEQKIQLLKYIETTLKSVESISFNKTAILKKYGNYWSNVNNIVEELMGVIGVDNLFNKKYPKILLIVGSDTSLCGSYNSSLVRFFQRDTNLLNKINEYEKIIVVGKKIKKISHNKPIFHYSFKEFFEQKIYKNLYEEGHFNIDILGYHTKEISIINCQDIYKKLLEKNTKNQDPFDVIVESNNLVEIFKEILFQKIFFFIVYTIETQENLQRLMFLKTATDNCESEIKINIQKHRSLRQELITKELNELIAANL